MSNKSTWNKEEKTLKDELRGTEGEKILKYTRSTPGRVFLEQYELGLGDAVPVSTITSRLNQFRQVNWIEGNETEDGVVTIPSQREKIKKIIANVSIQSVTTTPTSTLSFSSLLPGETSTITQNGESIGSCILDPNTYGITLSLTGAKEEKIIKSFCLNEICEAYSLTLKDECVPRIHFSSISANGVTFKGNTRLLVTTNLISKSTPWFSGLFDFSEATFDDDVVMQNIEYRIDSSLESDPHRLPLISFRSCKFMRNMKIQNLRIHGSSSNTQVSFEDAIIKGNFLLFNVDFGHAKLNCLQLVMGTPVYCADLCQKSTNNIKLKSISLAEDAQIDLSEVELYKGQVLLENIPSLCNTILRFKKKCQTPSESGTCPQIEVLIRNCTLKGILELCNIESLFFSDFNNAGSIGSTSKDKWGKASDKEKSNDRLVNALEKHFDTTKKNPSDINECAKNLAMLKKNYASLGMNDSEDAALIAYMKYNHHPDQWYRYILRGVYWLLDKTGKYGTSPVRILIWLFATWIISAISLCFAINAIGKALAISVANLLPFSSVFYSLLKIPYVDGAGMKCLIAVSAIESVLGSLLLAYFAIAIVRKTMR